MQENVLRILKGARNKDSFKKKKMKLLTNEQQESYKNAKICYIYKEKFGDKYAKDKKYGNHFHYTGEYISAGHSIYNLKYSIPKEIPAVSTMDQNMIIILLRKN